MRIYAAGILISLLVSTSSAQRTPIQITADLTDTPRQIYHAEIDIPVDPGPLTLTTPKWIPGHHSPAGPVSDIVGIVLTAEGHKLEWRRDAIDLYEFHLVVPSTAHMLHAHLDCIVTKRNTPNVAALQWDKLLLYPTGTPVGEILVQATVKVPEGWGIGTALLPETKLDPQHPSGGVVRFFPTTVERLQDSPVFAGQYFREYLLAPEVTPRHYLDLFASYPSELNLRPKFIDALSNLVRETGALYGARHYGSYRFLLTLTSNAGGGTEHHESSDNGMLEDALADDSGLDLSGELLPHEFTHSWNGKYRRPNGEVVPDFTTPLKGELLWVYEGLTDYLGRMLAARCGFYSPENYRESLALEAAQLDYEPGRTWRTTEDTAVSVASFRVTNIWESSGSAWNNWRRSWDYYPEGDLLWLDVDTTIRKLTDNHKSLHDFLVLFLGNGGNTGPIVAGYDFNEIVSDLNQVAPLDWAAFLRDRVSRINVHADTAGIVQGGYKLIYTDEPSAYEQLVNSRTDTFDAWFSLGISLDHDGRIRDVRVGSPADKAHLAPGEKIFAINGRIYTKKYFREVLHSSKDSKALIQLIVQNDSFVDVVPLDYHDGERYPHLVRETQSPAYLDDILKPLSAPLAAPE
jgi:predicted metalloprotease with PDZ domain